MTSYRSLDFNAPDIKASDRLDAIYELADYCIDLLQQNEEHHGEVIKVKKFTLQLCVTLYVLKILDFVFIINRS